LAEQILRLSGEDGSVDGKILITGLRPGERLHERLHTDSEMLQETGIPKIRKIRQARTLDSAALLARIQNLEGLVRQRDSSGIRRLLVETFLSADP